MKLWLDGIYLLQEFLPGALATFSGREYDASKNLGEFLEALGLKQDQFCTIEQVHEDEVILASSACQGVKADALITREKNLPVLIRTADCIPLFIYDPQTPAVGICHSGWKGTRKGIVMKTIRTMKEHFGSNPASLFVGIGPSIRESCYEVGQEFKDYFPEHVRRNGPKYFCDLIRVVKNQLAESGVKEDKIVDSNICTVCSVDRFFSARKEGQMTGRFISMIMLK